MYINLDLHEKFVKIRKIWKISVKLTSEIPEDFVGIPDDSSFHTLPFSVRERAHSQWCSRASECAALKSAKQVGFWIYPSGI